MIAQQNVDIESSFASSRLPEDKRYHQEAKKMNTNLLKSLDSCIFENNKKNIEKFENIHFSAEEAHPSQIYKKRTTIGAQDLIEN